MDFYLNEINYSKSEGQITLKFPMNDLFAQKIKKLGFFYENKYFRINSESFAVYFLQKFIGKDTIQTESYQEYKKTIQGEINAIKIKTENLNIAPMVELKGLKQTPLTHQVQAYRFINENKGVCFINDEQGVGKSYEALMYASQLNEEILILCPNFLVSNWKKEIEKSLFNNKDLIHVEGYDRFNKEKTKPYSKIKHIILDEVHNLNVVSSVRYRSCLQLLKNAETKILLSGRDYSSDYFQIYPIFKLLGKYANNRDFRKKFFNSELIDKRMVIHSCKESLLKASTSYFILRRTLKQCRLNSESVFKVHNCELNPKELTKYSQFTREQSFLLNGQGILSISKLLSSFKANHLNKIIRDLQMQSPNEKIIIASQFPSLLDSISKSLPGSNIYSSQNDYIAPITLLNTSQYREGVDLSFSKTLILLDSYSDETKNNQVQKRIERLSQSSENIFIYKMETEYLDKYLRLMPKGLDYQKQIKLISIYLNKFLVA